jgi:hypothetical protein
MGDVVWDFETWSERTKYVTLPFDEDASPSQTDLSAVELEAVWALAHRIHSVVGYRKRINAFKEKNDNDKSGKAAWNKWFDKVNRGWNVLKDMEILLDTYERHPRLMIGEGGVATVSGRH